MTIPAHDSYDELRCQVETLLELAPQGTLREVADRMDTLRQYVGDVIRGRKKSTPCLISAYEMLSDILHGVIDQAQDILE